MHTNDNENDVVKRLTVTLDDATHAALQEWADDEARTVANLVAYLALKGLKDRQEQVSKDKSKGAN